jgi:hypothetical protein
MSEQFGTVTPRPVHPASPVLLTKNGPLRTLHSKVQVQLSNTVLLTYLKFENRLKLFQLQDL